MVHARRLMRRSSSIVRFALRQCAGHYSVGMIRRVIETVSFFVKSGFFHLPFFCSWFSKAKKQTFSLSQTPPAGVPSVPVPTGLSRHSHQLQLRIHKKKDKQTENSARTHFIKGNNNTSTHIFKGKSGFFQFFRRLREILFLNNSKSA